MKKEKKLKYSFKISKLLKKIFKNFSLIAGSNLIVSFFSIFTLFYNSNSLGPKLFGVLALYTVSITVFNRLFSMDLWQQVIKFGGHAYVHKKYNSLRNIFAYCLLMEIFFSILSFLGANLLLYLIYFYNGFSDEYLLYGQIFSIALIFKFSDTPTGVLRLTNRFNVLAYINVLSSLSYLIGSAFFWYNNSSFLNYIILFTVISILYNLILILLTLFYWKLDKLPSLFRVNLNDKKLINNINKFSVTGWITSTISVMKNSFDLYIIGIFLDVSASGIYKFATSIASFVLKLSIPLQQAVFPEISKMAAKKQNYKLKKILLDIFGLVGFMILIVNILSLSFADLTVGIIGGEKFTAATIPLILLIFAFSIRSAGFFIRPVLINCIGHMVFLKSILYPFIIYVPVLLFGVMKYGVIGACVAHIVFDILLTIYAIEKINKYFKIKLSYISFSYKKFFLKN
jgi:O-antigen/teichoic acid export membrane protein